jgi:hypothetical protein
MSQIPGPDEFNARRVDEFMTAFTKFTGMARDHSARAQVLDQRLRDAALTLADKVEVLKRLAPRAKDSRLGARTDESKELRMERLLLSVAPEDLSRFKFALEYDGDYKDLEEYVFHDVDRAEYQDRIVDHLRTAPGPVGRKVLSDVDDTLYANLIDARYPRKTLYPGVLEFYDAVAREPFDALPATPITTLSARPNPIAGHLEEASLQSLRAFTGGRLSPSGLSGALVSSTVGTIQTLLRAELDELSDEVPDGQEAAIGRVKFENFGKFSRLYPEYHYVFVGDSGQADALTAQLMLTEAPADRASRVITTFIHDLRQGDGDARSASRAFRTLPGDLVIGRASPGGRGVIVFRNYIEAGLIAHRHSATLADLVTAEQLARITRAALDAFQAIDFTGREASGERLRGQYREDAEEAAGVLAAVVQRSSALEDDVKQIRRLLAEAF